MQYSTLTDSKKIRLGLAAGVAIFFALIIAVGLRNLAWVEEDRRIERTHQVIDQLNLLGLHSKDAENAFRRYAASPNASDLATGRESIRQTTNDVNEVARLTADNSAQQRNVGIVGSLVARQSQLLSQAGASPAENTVARALAALDQAGLSAAIGSGIQTMIAVEQRFLRERIERKENTMFGSRILFGTFATLAVLMIFVTVRRMTNDYNLRTATERQLAAKDAQYKQVVELAGDIIYRTDAQGRFTFCNQAALSILHYTEAEVLGRSYLKLIRQDKRREAERFYLRQFLRRQKSSYYEFAIVDAPDTAAGSDG